MTSPRSVGRDVAELRVFPENTILDLSQIFTPKVGVEAIVIGTAGTEGVTLAKLAAWQRTNPLALLDGLAKSLSRRSAQGPGRGIR